jgi:hypothetical protein
MDSLILLMLGAVLFLLFGSWAERTSIVPMADFKVVYYGSRCLLEHCDPYSPVEIEHVFLSEGGENPADSTFMRHAWRRIIAVFIYLPTASLLTAPFALLAWGPAHVLWMMLIAVSFLLAAYLALSLSESDAPLVSAGLIALFVASSGLLLEFGNSAGVAASLCVVAVWCFLQERMVIAGVLCLAVSLAMKPQDAGLVWLFFLLASGTYRRLAWQSLAATIVLSVPGVVWVWCMAPHWIEELRRNFQVSAAHGGLTAPGPTDVNAQATGAAMVNLQTLVSLIRDDPRFYNLVTYGICGALLAVWVVVTLRSRRSPARDRLALASIAALSMLPVYHRQHDTRLLLLMFPAFALLWAEGGAVAWLALLVTGAGIVFTANTMMQLLGIFAHHWQLASAGLAGRTLNVLMTRPAPIILLIISIFYLWTYVRHVQAAKPKIETSEG